MIYRKDANFPYPVLANTIKTYENNVFNIDVDITDDTDYFYFNLNKVEIESEFIKMLERTNKIKYIFIIKTKDNKFFKLKSKEEKIKISKTQLSLNDRTSIQVHLQAVETISFAQNEDLASFYGKYKNQIQVPKNGLIGFSNILVLEGRFKKPLELFSKKVEATLKSEVKIVLGSETIDIYYRDANFQFSGVRKGNALNLPYVYMGLQKALTRFVSQYSEDGEEVFLEDLSVPEDLLDQKLYNLMRNKHIEDFTIDTIDEVIHRISDKMINKYTEAVKELMSDGN